MVNPYFSLCPKISQLNYFMVIPRSSVFNPLEHFHSMTRCRMWIPSHKFSPKKSIFHHHSMYFLDVYTYLNINSLFICSGYKNLSKRFLFKITASRSSLFFCLFTQPGKGKKKKIKRSSTSKHKPNSALVHYP